MSPSAVSRAKSAFPSDPRVSTSFSFPRSLYCFLPVTRTTRSLSRIQTLEKQHGTCRDVVSVCSRAEAWAQPQLCSSCHLRPPCCAPRVSAPLSATTVGPQVPPHRHFTARASRILLRGIKCAKLGHVICSFVVRLFHLTVSFCISTYGFT